MEKHNFKDTKESGSTTILASKLGHNLNERNAADRSLYHRLCIWLCKDELYVHLAQRAIETMLEDCLYQKALAI